MNEQTRNIAVKKNSFRGMVDMQSPGLNGLLFGDQCGDLFSSNVARVHPTMFLVFSTAHVWTLATAYAARV
eukprot:2984092-Amphidinium_carterae.1